MVNVSSRNLASTILRHFLLLLGASQSSLSQEAVNDGRDEATIWMPLLLLLDNADQTGEHYYEERRKCPPLSVHVAEQEHAQ